MYPELESLSLEELLAIMVEQEEADQEFAEFVATHYGS